MNQAGKTLILVGLAITLIGILVALGPKIPYLGKLPGDISIERPGFSFYMPLTTSIILSALFSLIFWLFKR